MANRLSIHQRAAARRAAKAARQRAGIFHESTRNGARQARLITRNAPKRI